MNNQDNPDWGETKQVSTFLSHLPTYLVFIAIKNHQTVSVMTDPSPKKQKMASTLSQLKDYTVVVADTGDFEGKDSLQSLLMEKNFGIQVTLI